MSAYLYVEDYYQFPLDFYIWDDRHAYSQQVHFNQLKRVAYTFLLVAVIVHGLFLYVMLREKEQIHFLLFATFVGGGELLISSRLLPKWLALQWPLQEVLAVILFSLSLYHLCGFVDSFLSIRSKDPRTSRWLQCLKAGSLLTLLPLPFIFSPRLSIFYFETYLYAVGGMVVALFLICARRWLAGCKESVFFLLGLTPYIIPLGMSYTQYNSSIINHYHQQLAFFIGNGLCLLFLSFAAVYRHRLAIEQKVALQNKYKAYMDREVEIRTRALQKTSNDLATAMAERDRIITIIGHDLRSPVTSLLSLTHILAEKAHSFSQEELVQIAREMNQTCSLQLELLNNLLMWGSMHSTQWLRQAESVQLSRVLAEVWRPLSGIARNKQITCTISVAEDLFIYTDLRVCKTILRNLLSNALKFTPIGGQIQLIATANDRHVKIEVRDNGVGIPIERQKVLFKADIGSTAGTAGEKGIGVGLHICHDLAQAEAGTLWIESEPGKGTTAYLQLPRGNDPARAAQEDTARSHLQL